MKKVVGVLLIIGIYLYWSYGHFYNSLSQNRLYPSSHQTMIVVGTNPSFNTLKYAALGDSLTAGTGTADYKETFPYLVSQKLSSKQNIELYNFARAGDTSKDVFENQLPQVLSLKPDLVTLLIGTNDIHGLVPLSDFENNLDKIISAIKNSGAKLYLLSIPYLGSDKIVYPPYNTILDSQTRKFNKIINNKSIKYNVNLIDLYSLKKTSDFYSRDEFHPSSKGYAVWAEIINVN